MESSTRVLLCESSFWLWEPLIRSVRARNKNTCSHLKNGSLSILKKIHCELRDEVARTEGGRCPSHPPYKNFVFRIHTTGHKSKFHLRIFLTLSPGGDLIPINFFSFSSSSSSTHTRVRYSLKVGRLQGGLVEVEHLFFPIL